MSKRRKLAPPEETEEDRILQLQQDPFGRQKHRCTSAEHNNGKKKNCAGNPNCLFGLGEMKEGVWKRNCALLQNPTSRVPDAERHEHEGGAGKVPCGLKNLGNTCYLNCLLQCLFMNKSFLKGVYEWEPAAVGGAAAAPTNDATAHMKTLQRVFGRMQASARRFCDPKEFAEQLGVGAQQQDAQEFNSLLMSMLDNLLKLSDKDELKNHVPNLFRGKASYVTTCQNCKTESRRTNDFYELELPIESAMRKRAHDSVEECLRTYSSTVETLEGDNQYFCDRCNAKHDAQRSVVVDETPAYLTLQLMRFSYDRAKCAKTKVKHSVHCTPTLTLAADKFKLVAVMYHKGTGASGGHYTAEIKCPPSLSSCKEEWWKFDDETVTHIGAAGSQKPADQTAQAALGAATPQSVDLTGCDSDQEVETDEQERTPAGSHKTPSKKGKGKKSAVSAKQAVPQTPENKTSGSANAYMLIYQKCKRGASTLETLGESTGAATVNAALPAWLEAEIEAENKAFQLQLDQERDQTQRLREAIASRKRSHAAFVGTSESHVEDFGKDSEHWLRTDWLRHWVTGEHRQADAAGASSTHDLTAEDNTPSADVAAPALFSTTPDTLGNLCQHKKLDPRRVASGDFKRVPLDRFKQMHQEMRKEFGWPERYEIVHTCDDCEEAFKQESTEQNAERAQWTELLSDIDKSQQDGRGSTCGQFCLSKGWLKELRKRVSGNKPRVRGTLFDSFAVQGEAGAAGSLKLVNNDIKCECAKDREMEGEKARLVPDSKRQYHFVPEEVWRAIVDRFPEACELRLDDECALCKAKKDETQSAKSERVQTRDGAIAQLAELHKRPTSKHSSRWYPPTHTDVLSDRRLVGEFYVLPADWLAKWRALMRTSDEITLSLPPMPRCECGGSLPAPSLLAALNAVGQAQAADMDGKVDDVELVAKEDWDTLAETCAGDAGAEQRPCLLMVRSPGSDGWECEPKACPGCIQKREKELEEKNRKFENCPVRVHVLKAKDDALVISGAAPPAVSLRPQRRTTRNSAAVQTVLLSCTDTVMFAKLKCVETLQVDGDAARVQLYHKGVKMDNECNLMQLDVTLKSTLYLKVGSESDEWEACDAFESRGTAQPETGFAGSALLSGFVPRAAPSSPDTTVVIDVSPSSPAPMDDPYHWQCATCTLENGVGDAKCVACQTACPRSSPRKRGM